MLWGAGSGGRKWGRGSRGVRALRFGARGQEGREAAGVHGAARGRGWEGRGARCAERPEAREVQEAQAGKERKERREPAWGRRAGRGRRWARTPEARRARQEAGVGASGKSVSSQPCAVPPRPAPRAHDTRHLQNTGEKQASKTISYIIPFSKNVVKNVCICKLEKKATHEGTKTPKGVHARTSASGVPCRCYKPR